MALIRECQPRTIQDWENWYFENAKTDGKVSFKITKECLEELGIRLHEKITKVVIPEWQTTFDELSLQDCIDYIHNLTINHTFDGYIREKSVVNDTLAKIFTSIHFEESPPEIDHAGDVDYLGGVDKKAFGIQLKPVTAKANFGNYSISERMKARFQDFEKDFGGKVFLVFSLYGEVANKEILKEIEQEIQKFSR